MNREYIITSIKKHGEPFYGPYGGSQKYGVALEGISEPVSLTKTLPLDKEPEVGDVLYGRLHDETAKDGRTYQRFVAEDRPATWTDNSDDKAMWAIRCAVDCYLASTEDISKAYENIEAEAKHFYKMINKIKGVN